MPKYMIQDIVPPEKRKHSRGAAKTTLHDSPPEGAPHRAHKEVKETVHKKSPVPHVTSHEVPDHPSIPPTETPVPSKPEVVVHDSEIEDMLPENPRAMILEHLYEDSSRPNAPFVESHQTQKPIPEPSVDGGAWPYNEKTAGGDPVVKTTDFDHRSTPSFSLPPQSKTPHGMAAWIPWALIPLGGLVGLVFIMNSMTRADITITPKSEVVTFTEAQEFKAMKTPTADDLGYAVMKITLEDTTEVAATGTKTVTAKASGKIIVYNEQTTTQRLIKNTRFQSTAGKIYRITDSIVLPKAEQKSGKLVPGSLEVTVYADEAGPDFNSEPSDFTVPGLKELPQYTKVYARSKTPLSGGAAGTIKTVSDQDMRAAADNIRVSLETKLRSKARADIAPSQIAFEKGMVIELAPPTLSTVPASSPDRAVITQSGTLYLVVFERNALSRAIGKAMIPTYAGEGIRITDLDAIGFAMPEITGSALWESTEITFSLSGSPVIVWEVDEPVVRAALAGIPEEQFKGVMAGFSTVEQAETSLRPFWKTTYPQDVEDIVITIAGSAHE
jgi:hypothetical protein